MSYSNKIEIYNKALEAIGVPFKNIDTTNRINELKGGIGHLFEESFFDLTINSISAPDFSDAGVELKVTPYKRIRNNDISAKERLVLNIINFEEEAKKTFITSSFYKKNNTILMMFYEYDSNKSKLDWYISNIYMFELEKEDIELIKQDWTKIHNKILEGKAHEISEGDTLLLGACSKGKNKTSLRKQPFSDVLAMQRAYCFKTSYMTQLLRNKIFNTERVERIIKDVNILKNNSFEDYIKETVKPYLGLSQKQLADKFNLNFNNKSLNDRILSRIFNLSGSISKSDEFLKANIIPKTIRINKRGKINESMSFKAFKFLDLVNQSWEETDIYNTLSSTKFLFMIFSENENNEYIFSNIMFWNMPVNDLDEVEKVFKKTIQVIKTGVRSISTENKYINNFPKKNENRVSHIRPHARNSLDTYPLPNGECYTKQCFWLNNDYILEQIKKNQPL